MFKNLALATTVAMGLAGGASAATLIDFTDTAVWASGAATPSYGGVTVSLSSTGGPITQNGGAPGPVGPLAGLSDGLGTQNDEISFGGPVVQSITVTFSKAVRVTGLYFLDLFLSPKGGDLEEAIATFSGGEVVATGASVLPSNKIGFGSNESFGSIIATSVTFTADLGNDSLGEADFALAGLTITPIPLPASVLMFASAIVGMGVLSRRRAAA